MICLDIPAGRRRRLARVALIILGTAVCGAVLVVAYLGKQPCVGPTFDAAGRSAPGWGLRIDKNLCYSDIQQMWLGRDINLHIFPYVHGGLTADNQLTGGSIEYPVLTGLMMWLGAIGAQNDGQFLAHSALLLAPFGLLTAALLFALAGRRAWWFALAPALVMYAFLSWDLLPVACTTAGIAAIAGPGGWSPRRRAVIAGIAFGIGGAAKFYPLMFAAPVIGWLLWPDPARPSVGGDGDRPRRNVGGDGDRPRRNVGGDGAHPRRRVAGDRVRPRPGPDVAGALLVAVVTAGTFAVINVPFAIAGFAGWWASFEFQWSRPIDQTTNSIWYWAARPHSDPTNLSAQHLLSLLSTSTTAAAMVAVLIAGYLLARVRRTGYPWLQVCASLLCAYLLFNKVHSPQYTLWLLPFFVLLRIRVGWILAYFAVDAAMGIGFFRWQYLIDSHQPNGILADWPAQAVMIGVWGRAALLLGLAVAFLAARSGAVPWRLGGAANTERAGPTALTNHEDLTDRNDHTYRAEIGSVNETGRQGDAVGKPVAAPASPP